MVCFRISPSRLKGNLAVPPSKSHTLRALLFGMMGRGVTRISNPLLSADTRTMMSAIRQWGAFATESSGVIEIEGLAAELGAPSGVIDCGNSGLVLRLMGALAALSSHPTCFTGDASICGRRPIKPLIEGLSHLGVSAYQESYPLWVQGPLNSGVAHLNGADSQPVSGLLIACAYGKGPFEIRVSDPGETPWIALTLDWMRRLGLRVECQDYRHYYVPGMDRHEGFSYRVPADFSSALFPLTASLITGSSIQLEGLDFSDVQGDKAALYLIKNLPSEVDVNPFIDAIPALAVRACFADQETTLYNGAIARLKESDRLHAISTELKKMGADIEEREEGMVISPAPLRGARLFSHGDHRIAMALSVAALGAEGESLIQGVECIDKTYPSFAADMQSLGAQIEVLL